MTSTTLTVRVDDSVNQRLERLAKTTGRSRSVLAAELINDSLDVYESQVDGIQQAIASLDRGEGIPTTRSGTGLCPAGKPVPGSALGAISKGC
ncbi:CopG family ribbon-helix-helix protein [Bradyrhizobium oligotrophicum S58]